MGINSKYTQRDVEELTKIFTGVGMVDFHKANNYVSLKNLKKIKTYQELNEYLPFKMNDIFYLFDKNQHDFSDKKFLNVTIKGTGEEELNKVLDIVVLNINTANFLSNKLATYFLGENIDSKLIEDMQKEYLSSKGNIAKTLKVLFDSTVFLNSVHNQDKYKDVYSNYVSLYKLHANNRYIDNFDFLYNKLLDIDLFTYRKITPEGYSLKGKDYISSQIEYKNMIFSGSFIFYNRQHINQVLDFDFDFLSKININIKDKESFYFYVVSPEWIYQ